MSSFNKKTSKNKADHLIVRNEINKIKNFNLNYFIEKSHFEVDGMKNRLVFQPIYKYFKTDSSYHISSWRSKGLSNCLMKVLHHLLQLTIFLLLH